MGHLNLTYHIVWRTKCSRPTINEKFEQQFYRYVYGICSGKKCYLYQINSMPDHVHLCVAIHPTIAVSTFMQVLKQETSKWMKEHKEWFPSFEAWGNGYAAFTYSAKERPTVIAYIARQKEHHKKFNFQKEYEAWLKEMGLDPQKDLFLQD